MPIVSRRIFVFFFLSKMLNETSFFYRLLGTNTTRCTQPSFGVLEMWDIRGIIRSTEQENPVHHMFFFFVFFFHNKQKGNNIYTQSFHAVAEGKLNVELRIKKKKQKQGARSRRK